MKIKKTYVASKNENGKSLISFVKKVFHNTPLSVIHSTFRTKEVKINNKSTNKKDYLLKTNDQIDIFIDEKFVGEVLKTKTYITGSEALKRFSIVYEDDNLLVVNKPHNLNVEGDTNSLDFFVRSYLVSTNPDLLQETTFVPSHINRIDKKAFGLVLYGKNYEFLTAINEIYGDKNFVTKKYIVICKGVISKPLTLEGYIYLDKNGVPRYNEHRKGKTAITKITPLGWNDEFSVLSIELLTGRKNQIRASLAYIKCPVVGDDKYDMSVRFSKHILLANIFTQFKNLSNQYSYLNDLFFRIDQPTQFNDFIKKHRLKIKLIK